MNSIKKVTQKNFYLCQRHEIEKIFNDTEVLRENIRKNDEEEYKKRIKDNNWGFENSDLADPSKVDDELYKKWHDGQLTKSFGCDYTEGQSKEIVKLFKEEGFKANSSNKSLYLKFIEHELKCFEKVSKNTFKISHKKAIAKRILDREDSFKYLKCFLSLQFCNDLEWIRKDSKIKNDPNKNLDKFNKELNTGHKNCVNDLFYAAFSAYSSFLISEDKTLTSRLKELCKILPFEAINLEEFLKS